MDDLARQFIDSVRVFVETRTPYVHRGTTLRGCDCTGMLIGALHGFNKLKTYKLRKYPPDWNLHAGASDFIHEELLRVADDIPDDEASPGDILLFRFGKCPAHAGVLIQGQMFAHCHVHGKKCCYSMLNNSPWGKRWVGTMRLSSKKLERYDG